MRADPAPVRPDPKPQSVYFVHTPKSPIHASIPPAAASHAAGSVKASFLDQVTNHGAASPLCRATSAWIIHQRDRMFYRQFGEWLFERTRNNQNDLMEGPSNQQPPP